MSDAWPDDDRHDRASAERAELEADLLELAREEVRRRTEAPVPRSLLDFLR